MNSRSTLLFISSFVLLPPVAAQGDDSERGYYADGIGLERFLSEAYPAITFTLESPLDSYQVNGTYEGTRSSILDRLAAEHEFEYTEVDGIVQLSLESEPELQIPDAISLQAWDISLVQFATELSSIANYTFDIDTSIKDQITGSYSGSAEDILETLSFEHEYLIDTDEASASIMGSGRAVSSTIDLPEGFLESEWYTSRENKSDRFGNSHAVSTEFNTVTITGHPRFVSRNALDFYAAISTFKPVETTPSAPEPTTLAAAVIDPVAMPTRSMPTTPVMGSAPKMKQANNDFFADLESIPGFY